MPLRVLGLVVDPSQAGDFCGHAFKAYRSSGVEVTVASAAELVGETGADGISLEAGAQAIAALIERQLPHIVVVDGRDAGLKRAAVSGFTRACRRLRGRSPLPAKLYSRAYPPLTPAVTTVLVAPGSGEPELFIRERPAPWVTGVLEHDLFAGLNLEPETAAERLAA